MHKNKMGKMWSLVLHVIRFFFILRCIFRQPIDKIITKRLRYSHKLITVDSKLWKLKPLHLMERLHAFGQKTHMPTYPFTLLGLVIFLIIYLFLQLLNFAFDWTFGRRGCSFTPLGGFGPTCEVFHVFWGL